MTANGWLQILLFFVAVIAVTPPMGVFLQRVLEGERHFLRRPLGWLERMIYRVSGVDGREQSWQVYAGGLLAFSAITLLVTYAIQRLQHVLPFNPQGLPAVEAGSAFNTAASFTTNTNWQGYGGEATMSYLSQMAGLAWHNFISAAAGIAVAVALARVDLLGQRERALNEYSKARQTNDSTGGAQEVVEILVKKPYTEAGMPTITPGAPSDAKTAPAKPKPADVAPPASGDKPTFKKPSP